MSETRVYTFVLDYRGGTSLHQCSADHLDAAVEQYLNAVEREAVLEDSAELRKEFAGSPPVPVEGLRRVWCSSALLDGELALLHIIG